VHATTSSTCALNGNGGANLKILNCNLKTPQIFSQSHSLRTHAKDRIIHFHDHYHDLQNFVDDIVHLDMGLKYNHKKYKLNTLTIIVQPKYNHNSSTKNK
jgi:hypothetical protein